MHGVKALPFLVLPSMEFSLWMVSVSTADSPYIYNQIYIFPALVECQVFYLALFTKWYKGTGQFPTFRLCWAMYVTGPNRLHDTANVYSQTPRRFEITLYNVHTLMKLPNDAFFRVSPSLSDCILALFPYVSIKGYLCFFLAVWYSTVSVEWRKVLRQLRTCTSLPLPCSV